MSRIDYGGLVAAATVLVSGLSPAWGVDETRVGLITIEGAPLEQPDPMARFFPTESLTLRQLTGMLDEAASRDDIDSVVISLKDATIGVTQVEELGAAMQRVREAGKTVHVYSYGYGMSELLLGAGADSVMIQSGGGVSFPGLYMEEMFLGDTLRWAGLLPQLVQIGKYKGASEAFMNSAPSEPWDENITQLLDSLYANIRQHMKDGRDLTDEQLDEAMRRTWLANAETAKEVGLVDDAVDLAMLGDHLGKKAGAEVKWVDELRPQSAFESVDPFDVGGMMQLMSKVLEPEGYGPTGPTIAVLHVSGPIVDGESKAAGLFGGATVGSRTIRNALEDILAEDEIKGVVVRIDSPGGSAVASEVIWQGLRRVAEKKPVWASVGSMAASGGYYVAVGSDKIYANESSIVGSIGVVGGKISPTGLYEKVKIHAVGRARGPMADMFGSAPWTPEQEDLVRAKMTETYDLFVDRVRAGRPGIDPAKTAEGRLFTGDKAVGLQMVDALGGLDQTIEELAGELSLDEYDVLDYPAPKTLLEMIEEAFGAFATAPGVAHHSAEVALLREAVGPEAWANVCAVLEGLAQLRKEPVLMLVPRVFVVR